MQSPEIQNLIREHAERLEAETTPVRIEELEQRSKLPVKMPWPRWTGPIRGPLTAIATAIVVLIAVGGVALLLNTTSDEVAPRTETVVTTDAAPAPTTPPAPTVSPAPATPPAPTVSPASFPTSWTAIETDMTAHAVTAGPGGFVAIDILTSSTGQLLTWFSADGTTWSNQVLPTSSEAIDFAPPSLDSIYFGGPGYVAFGGSWGIDIRFSVDGQTWVPADHVDAGILELTSSGDFAPGTYGEMEGMAYGNGRYVAVGEARDVVEEPYSNPRAAVWTSFDGLTWIRLPDDDEVFNGPWHQEMSAVTYGANGFVAVGYSEDDSGSSSVGAIWHSPDGTDWTRIPDDEALFGEYVEDDWHGLWNVTYGDSGYVAVGWIAGEGDKGTVGSVWHSLDGTDWTRIEEEGFDGPFSFHDMAYGDGSYVLVGAVWSPDPNEPELRIKQPAIWYSSDAVTWTRLSPKDSVISELVAGTGSATGAIAYADGRFVVVGYDTLWPEHPTGNPSYSGHVWIGEAVR